MRRLPESRIAGKVTPSTPQLVDSAYGIMSQDETLVALGLEYWESPRCCIAS